MSRGTEQLLFFLQLGCAPITPKLDRIFRVEQVNPGELHGLKLISKKNQPLKLGDEIETDANTIITLIFPGGTEVIIKPNTHIKILDFAVELIPKTVKMKSSHQKSFPPIQKPIHLASLNDPLLYPYWLAELTNYDSNQNNTTSNIWEYFGELFITTKTYLRQQFPL